MIGTSTPRTVNIIGDFSSFVDSEVDLERLCMVPYSSQNCVSEVQSPFSLPVGDNNIVSPMVLVDFPIVVSTDDSVMLSGNAGFLSGLTSWLVGPTTDTHVELEYDVSALFAGNSITVSSSSTFDVDDISVVTVIGNQVSASVTTFTPVDFSSGDVVEFCGLTSPEWTFCSPEVTVTSVEVTMSFTVAFTYPRHEGNDDKQRGLEERPVVSDF